MALDKRLLDILCCPATKQPVAPLSSAQLAAINRAIDRRSVRSVDGSTLDHPLAAGLLTRDGRTVYRIDDGIPVMLVDQGVSTGQIEGFPV
jgi:uncharacterized protein YbaR (Trm112 family)